MLDVAAAREGLRDRVISDIGFFRSRYDISDTLMKEMSRSFLRKIVFSCQLDIQPEQWMIRLEEIT